MKKIIFVAIVVAIPVLVIIYGVYYFGPYQQQKEISLVMDELKTSYYKGVASVCYKKKISQNTCCLESVKEMSRIKGRLANEPICGDLSKDTLKCNGSYEWCVPAHSSKKDDNDGGLAIN